jgi:hypothetical protein
MSTMDRDLVIWFVLSISSAKLLVVLNYYMCWEKLQNFVISRMYFLEAKARFFFNYLRKHWDFFLVDAKLFCGSKYFFVYFLLTPTVHSTYFCTVSTCYICTGIVGIHTFNSQSFSRCAHWSISYCDYTLYARRIICRYAAHPSHRWGLRLLVGFCSADDPEAGACILVTFPFSFSSVDSW